MKMDVQEPGEVEAVRKAVEKAVGDNGLTLLINNAGVAMFEPFPNITEENMLKHFTVNTVGPVRMFQEMYPLLKKAASKTGGRGMSVSKAAVLNMSSLVGSIKRTGVEFLQDLYVPGYKVSKAGLNMAMRVISANVKDDGILVIMMCPGWVKTDMGTNMAKISPEESISDMLKTLEKLNESHHGSYMDRFGKSYDF